MMYVAAFDAGLSPALFTATTTTVYSTLYCAPVHTMPSVGGCWPIRVGQSIDPDGLTVKRYSVTADRSTPSSSGAVHWRRAPRPSLLFSRLVIVGAPHTVSWVTLHMGGSSGSAIHEPSSWQMIEPWPTPESPLQAALHDVPAAVRRPQLVPTTPVIWPASSMSTVSTVGRVHTGSMVQLNPPDQTPSWQMSSPAWLYPVEHFAGQRYPLKTLTHVEMDDAMTLSTSGYWSHVLPPSATLAPMRMGLGSPFSRPSTTPMEHGYTCGSGYMGVDVPRPMVVYSSADRSLSS